MADESVEQLRWQVSEKLAHIKKLNAQAKAIIAGFTTTKEHHPNGTG